MVRPNLLWRVLTAVQHEAIWTEHNIVSVMYGLFDSRVAVGRDRPKRETAPIVQVVLLNNRKQRYNGGKV